MANSRNRSIAAIVISLAALAVIIGALWPRSDRVRTEAERVDHIASRMRCPFCSGESIADATAQVARDLEVVIAEQVAAGMTDEEIYDFFAARYGESLLLDPPLLGWGWALWVLPLGALAAGGFAVARRRRRGSDADGAPAADSLEQARIREQLDYVRRDRAEIAAQEARGEIDHGTAVALAMSLDDEARSLTEALTVVDEDDVSAEPTRRDRRVWAGAAVLVVGAAVVAATLLVTADDAGEGGVVDAPPLDLASITTEQLEGAVAANPDVIPMRLALGQMLMDDGEVARAAVQFGEVLQREENNPEALAWLGWISFLAEQHETAEAFLVDALAVEPDYPQAQWWLANVRILGLDDPAGAVAPLEDLLASPGVPDDVRASAAEMLEQARERS